MTTRTLSICDRCGHVSNRHRHRSDGVSIYVTGSNRHTSLCPDLCQPCVVLVLDALKPLKERASVEWVAPLAEIHAKQEAARKEASGLFQKLLERAADALNSDDDIVR